MFWRGLWKLFRASRGRLGVALLALGSGAAVCSALINLQLDAERKLTREFRALGANVIVSPLREARAAGNESPLMSESVYRRIGALRSARVLAVAPYLYLVARSPVVNAAEQRVIVGGTMLDEVRRMASWWKIEGQWVEAREHTPRCLVGRNAARQLGVKPGSTLELRFADRSEVFTVAGVVIAGGTEDNQVFVNLPRAQELAGLEERIGLVQLSVSGSPFELEAFTSRLATALPGFEVRPVRQLAEAEGHLLGRIRVLILSAVALILALMVGVALAGALPLRLLGRVRPAVILRGE